MKTCILRHFNCCAYDPCDLDMSLQHLVDYNLPVGLSNYIGLAALGNKKVHGENKILSIKLTNFLVFSFFGLVHG